MSHNVKLKDLKINWEDYCISMDCPYCGEEVILGNQMEPVKCGNCGHIYELVSYVNEIIQHKKK